jgi:hypothetical protein
MQPKLLREVEVQDTASLQERQRQQLEVQVLDLVTVGDAEASEEAEAAAEHSLHQSHGSKN